MRKTLRTLLLVAAAVLLGYALSDYSDSRHAPAGDTARSTPKLPVEVAAKAQHWNWSQSTGDSSRVEIFAESFSQDASGGQIDLYGVELRIFHDAGSTYDRVVSAAATFSLTDGKLFSAGETVITLGVPSDGKAESPTVITTSAVTFYTKSNQARTEQPTAYAFDGGRGRSVGAVYESGTSVLHMKSDVYLERFAAGRGESATQIRAGELYYHEQAGRIDLRQRARVERGAQWLECDEGTVRLYAGVVRKIEASGAVGGERGEDRDVRFETPRFEAHYSEKQVLERLHGYGATTFTATNKLQTLAVNGERMTLFYRPIDSGGDSELERVDVRRASRLRIEPHGAGLRRTVVSEALELRMRPGGREIERVETHEPGRIELIPAGQAGGGRRTLDAERLRIDYDRSNRMRALLATGNVRLVRGPEQEGAPALETWSGGLEAAFGPEADEMTRLRQWDGFRFVEGERRGRADEGIFDVAANALELTGKAEVADAAGRVTARRIVLERTARRLEAETDVTSVFSGEGAEDSAEPGAGLFAEDVPVYAAAAKMLSDQENGVIEYRGRARLWQNDNRVEAERITIDRRARALTAQRQVATSLTADGAAGEAPATVTVYADDLRYDEDSRLAVFDGQVDFRRDRLRVLSDSLTAVLRADDGEAGSMERATAAGAVKIFETAAGEGRSGFGERAVYDPEAAAIVLTGRPARVVSAAGDETRGAELTYLTDGDRLRVSGQGSDRAYTYRRARK